MKITKRSGGPKTAVGKLAASMNALKTGVYSNMVVLPGEDASEFLRIEKQFMGDFSPQDMAEAAMVRELSVVFWKKMRLEQLGHAAALRSLSAPIQEDDFIMHNVHLKAHELYLVEDIARFTDAYVDAQNEVLGYVRKFGIQSFMTREAFRALKNAYPSIYQGIVDQGPELDSIAGDTPTEAEMLDGTVMSAAGHSEAFIVFALFSLHESAELAINFYSKIDKIKEVIATVKDARLLRLMDLERPRRLHDDLSRDFYRTLQELRKHQQWRQTRPTIDITPKLSP